MIGKLLNRESVIWRPVRKGVSGCAGGGKRPSEFQQWSDYFLRFNPFGNRIRLWSGVLDCLSRDCGDAALENPNQAPISNGLRYSIKQVAFAARAGGNICRRISKAGQGWSKRFKAGQTFGRRRGTVLAKHNKICILLFHNNLCIYS